MVFQVLICLEPPMLAVAEGILRTRLRDGFNVIGTSEMLGVAGKAAMRTVDAIVANRSFREDSDRLILELKFFM